MKSFLLFFALYIAISLTSAASVGSQSRSRVADVRSSGTPDDDDDDCETYEEEVNTRPIIGILSQPAGGLGPEVLHTLPNAPEFDEYIAGSYVKFVQSAGARVVAVRFNQSKSELRKLFRQLNGLLIPGGGANVTRPNVAKGDPRNEFYEAGEAIWDFLAEDETWPVFGTCLGFELLAEVATGGVDVLGKSSPFNATNVSWPLTFTAAAKDSRLFGGVYQHDRRLYRAMSKYNITYNAHSEGITPDVYRSHSKLNDEFEVLATGFDKNGKEFVAAMETKLVKRRSGKGMRGRNVFAVQFHPEKSVFEWFSPIDLNHSGYAVRMSQALANTFVDEARKNTNSFNLRPEDEAKLLIENHQRLFLGNDYFNEIFVFKSSEPQLTPELILQKKQVAETQKEYQEKNKLRLTDTFSASKTSWFNFLRPTRFNTRAEME